MRTRVELYATAFKAGAKKSETAIMQTLKPLHLVPEHLWQGLGRQGRAFRSFVDQGLNSIALPSFQPSLLPKFEIFSSEFTTEL